MTNPVKSPRFLICRLSAVGDTVHTLPLAHLIKQRWPDAFIAWAVEKGPSPLVEWCPMVDETIIVPKGFLKSPGQLAQVRRRLRTLRIDIVLDPQSLTKSAVLAWLSGAKRRIGFSRPIGRELAPWLHSTLVQPEETHVVRRYLEVLKPLGVRASECDIVCDLPHDDVSESTIRRYLAAVLPNQDFAVINPGAGWDSKVWPAECYAAVAKELRLPSIVVWAGEKERAWAQQIVADSAGKACLAPETSLLELTALCRQARLFIGSDTGPLHIAAAVGTPCVAMYGPTRPEVCGPYGPGHTVLQAASEDLGSARKTAGIVSDAMLQITPEQVVTACRRALTWREPVCRVA
jgi:lipopolysaccharide heptosyltransferase I